MTQPSGVAPYTVPGEVLRPDAVLDPISMAAHAFSNVVRQLITNSPAFKAEQDVHAALDAVDAFEKRLIPSKDHAYVAGEDDLAAREDVSKRQAPISGYAPPPTVPQLDYGALARAIIQAQSEAQASAPVPPANPQGV